MTRHLLALRPDLSDQTILDYLDLTTMALQGQDGVNQVNPEKTP
jgi:hypothetical protein